MNVLSQKGTKGDQGMGELWTAEKFRSFFHGRFNACKPYVFMLLKSAVVAGGAGIVCGLVGTLFHYAVDKATDIRLQLPWLLYLLPVAGIVIAWLYHIAGLDNDRGTNLILESIRENKHPPLRLAGLIFIGTVLTHLCGGSSGREGAALQIGGSLGSGLGRCLRLSEKQEHILIMCGMSGLFSALFGTPVTATLFSMEVISVGIFHYSAFLPCICSSLVSYKISLFFGVQPVAYHINLLNSQGFDLTWRIALLALACALVSILFCKAMHLSSYLYRRFLTNAYLRAAVGGGLVVIITLLIGTRDYNGAGMDIVGLALGGHARPEAFLLKILLTALTLGAGFKGGEIVPAFFIGSTFGCVAGQFLGLDPSFAAALGLVSVFCGVVNCPIASIILSIELFGSGNVLAFAFACAISYLMSGSYSLYSSQRITYSKLEPTFINAKTK